MIEENFHPVWVANNQGGEHRKILKKFKEPAWNYQVIRILDKNFSDIIPRKDGITTKNQLAVLLKSSLQAAERKVPKALALMTGA